MRYVENVIAFIAGVGIVIIACAVAIELVLLAAVVAEKVLR